MVLWLIQDGEKSGPFEDYEVREMIRDGKVTEETRVWHEGAEGWVTAPEVPVLEGEFVNKVVEPPPIPRQMPPFLAWRRLGARFFDFTLYSLVFNGILLLLGHEMSIQPDQSGWILVARVVPVILMEAALVSSFGFTPGKWLLGLRVETRLKQRLSTGQAIVRSMRVWVLGMGMMELVLMFLGHCLSLWFGLKKGGMLWDLQSGFQVANRELPPKRVIFYWVAFTLVFGANIALVIPQLPPEIWQDFEEELRRQRG